MAELAIALPFTGTDGFLQANSGMDTQKNTIIPFTGGEKPIYGFRGRDSGVGAPNPTYVGWTGDTPTTAYGGALAYGGPVVDIIVWRIK